MGHNRALMKKLALLLLPLGLLSGCSLNMKKVEENVSDMIEEQTDAKVDEVECPKERKIKEGDEFDCEIEFKGGGDGKVTVTQQGGGKYKMELEPIVVLKKVTKKLEKNLKKKGINSVECKGDEVRHVEEGDKLVCHADAGGEKKKITIEFLDEDGDEVNIKIE
jgi:hypothetical protein